MTVFLKFFITSLFKKHTEPNGKKNIIFFAFNISKLFIDKRVNVQ